MARSKYSMMLVVLVGLAIVAVAGIAQATVIDAYASAYSGVYKYSYDTVSHAVTQDTLFVLNSNTNGLARPFGLAIGPDDLLYVANQDGGNVQSYNRQTGAFVSNVSAFGSIDQPIQVKFGPDGNGDGVADVYVTEMDPGSVKRIATQGTGAGTVNAYTSGATTGRGPAFAFTSDGRLILTDAMADGTAKVFDSTGAYASDFATRGGGTWGGTWGIAIDANGNVYLGGGNVAIDKYDSTGNHLGTVGTLADVLGGQLMTFGPDYNGNGSLDLYSGNNGGGYGIQVIDGSTGLSIGEMIGLYDTTRDIVFAAPVPEPSAIALLATGLLGLLAYAWRRRK